MSWSWQVMLLCANQCSRIETQFDSLSTEDFIRRNSMWIWLKATFRSEVICRKTVSCAYLNVSCMHCRVKRNISIRIQHGHHWSVVTPECLACKSTTFKQQQQQQMKLPKRFTGRFEDNFLVGSREDSPNSRIAWRAFAEAFLAASWMG